jgi:hypothetical protein
VKKLKELLSKTKLSEILKYILSRITQFLLFVRPAYALQESIYIFKISHKVLSLIVQGRRNFSKGSHSISPVQE